MILRHNHFYAVQGKQSELLAFAQSLREYIETSKGNLGFEVWQSDDDPTHIIVLEKWENQDAHKASLANYPKELMQQQMMQMMPLLAKPPIGEYFS